MTSHHLTIDFYSILHDFNLIVKEVPINEMQQKSLNKTLISMKYYAIMR
jgi:hypothetical protein